MILHARALRSPRRWLLLAACASILCSTGCDPQGAPAPELPRGWFHTPAGWFELDYEEHQGRAVLEGDLLAPLPGPREQGVGALSATFDGDYRWPRGVMPYVIDPALPNPQRVLDAAAHWNTRTNIRLVPRTDQKDYVVFRPLDEQGLCYSYVGRKGGAQDILLSASCSPSSTAHEIGHAVGLYHEQSRQDRDRYIQIFWENIDSNRWGAFTTYLIGQDLGPYDVSSIMHYGSYTFSNNGRPTILQQDGSLIPANRTVLTATDIWSVNTLYDELPPTLSVEGLAQGALVRSVVTAQVSASDDRYLKSVDVWVDGLPGSAPHQGSFTYDWHTEQLPDGVHTLWVLARDGGDNTVSRTLTVTTDNTPPQVGFDSSVTASVLRGQATLAAYAYDAHGVSVDFHLVPEGVQDPLWSALQVPPPYTLDLDTLSLPNGTYRLQVIAKDPPGNTSQASVPVTVQNARVVLTAAVGLKVWGTVPLSADVDGPEPIASVEFWVDGRRIGSDARAPYTVSWNTGGVREGTTLVSRRLTAVAFDAAGMVLGRSAPRDVVVLCSEGATCD